MYKMCFYQASLMKETVLSLKLWNSLKQIVYLQYYNIKNVKVILIYAHI